MNAWIVPVALLASWLITGWVLRRAHALQLIDVPNERSSHSRPTPRGGGVAIATVCSAVLTLGWIAEWRTSGLAAVAIGGALIAVLGFLDDRFGLSARLRFLIQIMVVGGTGWLLGGLPDEVGHAIPWISGVIGLALLVLVVVWFLNLFNFMDGIDGIAAGQAAFMAGGAAWLLFLAGADPAHVWLLAAIAAASLGFLIWNRPPARIFMGDVGSAYLGYLLPMLAVWLSREAPISAWAFIVLGALFVGDASATLMRRTIDGHRWHEAHRSHVYQRLARRFGHARVTAGFALVNVLVILPLAWVTAHQPQFSAAIAATTTIVTVVAFWRLGAGRKDEVQA